MSTTPKIKCLQGLPLAMTSSGDRHLLKALETFCFIKSLWDDEDFPATARNVQHIANLSIRSTKTIWRRIDELIGLGWLRRKGSGDYLEHISWNYFRERYHIEHSRRYYFTPCQRVQLEYLIKAKVIKEKQDNIRFGYKAHVRRETIRAKMIQQVSGSLKAEAVAEHQLTNFLTEGKVYDPDTRYALSLQYTKRSKGEQLNGDLHFNYRTGTRIFGYQSDGGYAVLKRRLEQLGVIYRECRRVVVEKGTNTTTAARKTRLGFVKFDEEKRTLWLIRPDAIEVIPNCHVDDYNKQLSEAFARNEKPSKAA